MNRALAEIFRCMYGLDEAEARRALAPFRVQPGVPGELLVGRRFGGAVDLVVGGLCVRNDLSGLSLGTFYQALVPLWVGAHLRVPVAFFLGLAEEAALQPESAAAYADLGGRVAAGIQHMADDFGAHVEIIDTSVPTTSEAIDQAREMLRVSLREDESRWLYEMRAQRDPRKPPHSPARCRSSERVVTCHSKSFLRSFFGRPEPLIVEDVEHFAAARCAETWDGESTDFLAFLPLPDLHGTTPMFRACAAERVAIADPEAALRLAASSAMPTAVGAFHESVAAMLPVGRERGSTPLHQVLAYAASRFSATNRPVVPKTRMRRTTEMTNDAIPNREGELDEQSTTDSEVAGRTPLVIEGPVIGRRMLSGLQPSGSLHLGNYFGAMHQHIEGQVGNEGYYFIATYHAMTTVKDRDKLRQMTLDVALDYLAVGLDPDRVALYRQTDLPEVTELAWLLGCVGSAGDLDRAVSYKDKVSHGIVPNIGLYTYPVLMAADILILRAEVVPVGQDQLQHIEMARRFAWRFNKIYGNPILTIPQAKLNEAKTVPGIDGQKMSKSYGNAIPLFGDHAAVRKLIYSIRTDSTPIDEPKAADGCRLYALLKLLATPDEALTWAQRYRQGGLRYGDVKQRLVELYESQFGEARERRMDLAKRPDRVEEILQEGARKARRIAHLVMEEVREAVGIPPRPCA